MKKHRSSIFSRHFPIHLLIVFMFCFGTAMGSKPKHPGGPEKQQEAAYWLKISVMEVTQSDDMLTAEVKVEKVFKGDGVKVGDTVSVAYQSALKPTMDDKGRPVRPQGPPPLKTGQATFAFLNPSTEGTFVPGAGVWSFAPPFGISAEDQKTLGIELPRPPAFAPPQMKGVPLPPMKGSETKEAPPATKDMREKPAETDQ